MLFTQLPINPPWFQAFRAHRSNNPVRSSPRENEIFKNANEFQTRGHRWVYILDSGGEIEKNKATTHPEASTPSLHGPSVSFNSENRREASLLFLAPVARPYFPPIEFSPETRQRSRKRKEGNARIRREKLVSWNPSCFISCLYTYRVSRIIEKGLIIKITYY